MKKQNKNSKGCGGNRLSQSVIALIGMMDIFPLMKSNSISD